MLVDYQWKKIILDSAVGSLLIYYANFYDKRNLVETALRHVPPLHCFPSHLFICVFTLASIAVPCRKSLRDTKETYQKGAVKINDVNCHGFRMLGM